MRPSPSQATSAGQPVVSHSASPITQTMHSNRPLEAKGKKEEKEKTGAAQATVWRRPPDSTLTVEPCEDQLCALGVGWLAATCALVTKEKVPEIAPSQPRDEVLLLHDTYIHTELSVCRSSVNPAPVLPSLPNPSIFPCASVASDRWVPPATAQAPPISPCLGD